jgi:tRNA threonylcarbamoyladenosine biosynthesis protein TsaB
MEVYTAVYDQGLQTVIPARPLIIDASWEEQFPVGKNLCFFGNGMAKCRSILEKHPLSVFMDDIRPSAVHMVRLGEEKFQNGEFENTAYFEPFYLKEFQAGKSKNAG